MAQHLTDTDRRNLAQEGLKVGWTYPARRAGVLPDTVRKWAEQFDLIEPDNSGPFTLPEGAKISVRNAGQAVASAVPSPGSDSHSVEPLTVSSSEAEDMILAGEAPDRLIVEDYLDLSSANRGEWRDGFYVESDPLQLPEVLVVLSFLNLRQANVEALPDVLAVGGGLSFPGTAIRSWPRKLQIGGGLNIEHAEINCLPEGLDIVKGHLFAGKSKLSGLNDLRYVHHTCDLHQTPIEALPAGFTVGRDLDLRRAEKLSRLPAKLKVGRNLDICGSGVSALPDDLQAEKIFCGDGQIEAAPEHLQPKISVID